MSKPINEPRMVQQALIADEDLSFELAALVPTANGITNAASTFIDKADQMILKKNFTGQKAEIVAKCIDICQHVVKEGATISRLLRNPAGSMQRLWETREPEGPVQPDTDEIIAEIVGEIEAAHNADEANENGED